MAEAKKTKEKVLSFEESLERLSEIADILENKNPPLSDALSLYEESTRIIKECTKMLDEAQIKITQVEK